MSEKVPVYDNHIHMSPSGRNVDALREYEAAGGTGLTLVTLPYAEVQIHRGEDFAESYGITYGLARKARWPSARSEGPISLFPRRYGTHPTASCSAGWNWPRRSTAP